MKTADALAKRLFEIALGEFHPHDWNRAFPDKPELVQEAEALFRLAGPEYQAFRLWTIRTLISHEVAAAAQEPLVEAVGRVLHEHQVKTRSRAAASELEEAIRQECREKKKVSQILTRVAGMIKPDDPEFAGNCRKIGSFLSGALLFEIVHNKGK